MELLASLVNGAIATGCIVCNWFGGSCVGLDCAAVGLPGLGLGLGIAGATAVAKSVTASSEGNDSVYDLFFGSGDVPAAVSPPPAGPPVPSQYGPPVLPTRYSTPQGKPYWPGYSPRPPEGWMHGAPNVAVDRDGTTHVSRPQVPVGPDGRVVDYGFGDVEVSAAQTTSARG